ncbi:MAG TPA: hypothetical protein VHB77_19570, partial [Planctomycetaceae bacterium]|nr:hypothetical protein [Planctomycetaceae bacterium]
RGYNPKAKGGHVRRLRVMHRLDPDRTHELVEQALESGSADMKVVAIECLEGREDSLSFLLEQARAKAQDVRRAAYNAMATLTDDIVVETLTKALSGADVELSAEAASRNRSPKLLTFLLDDARKRLQALPGMKNKADAGKAAKHVYALLRAFATRDDKQSVAFLSECFEQRNDIGALKAEFDVDHINRRVASLLFRTGAKPALKLLVDAHETLPPEVVDWAIAAAIQTRKPREVYDLFSPLYLAKPAGKRKGSDDGTRRRDVVREILETLSQRHRYYWYGSGSADDTVRMDDFIESAELDPRWLDAAIESDDLHLVRALARPKHKPTAEYLTRSIDGLLAKKGEIDHEADDVLETMIRIEHPQAVEKFLAALQKAASGKHHYYAYWLVRLAPRLPKTAVPQLEAVLPTFPEKFADQLVPYLAELQGQS